MRMRALLNMQSFRFLYVLSPITMRPIKIMKGTKYLLLLAKVAPVDSSHLTLEEFRPPGKLTRATGIRKKT